MKQQLMCGAAIRDITPSMEYIRGLRGLMGARYGGVHDNLKVRVLAFSNGTDKALIIQPDTDKDQSPVRELEYISGRWGIPQENILYFGIHTHAAPMHTGRHEIEDRLTDEDRDYVHECTHKYEERFFSMMHEAIDEALANMKPCTIGVGKSLNYTNVRRVEDYKFYGPDGKLERTFASQGNDVGADVSHEMFVMQVKDLEGSTIAFLINFPMHCVVMFQNHLGPDGTDLISGDVAGNVSQTMEKRYPGAVCVWSSGAAGDMNPIPNTFASYVDPLTNEMKSMRLQPLAEEILNYIVANQCMSIFEALNSIPYFSGRADIVGAVEYSKTPKYRKIPQGKGFPKIDTTGYADETYDIRLQTLRIGDQLLIGVGGELFNSYAEELKRLSPVKNTAVINHNLSLISLVGYILDDNAISRGYAMRPGMISEIVPGHISDSLKAHFNHMMEEL